MHIFHLAAQKISRLNVVFYHLIWSLRHKGLRGAASFLSQRLGFTRRKSRPGCKQDAATLSELNAKLAQLKERPLFTLIVPAGKELGPLQVTLDSFKAQVYPRYQIILITNPEDESAAWLSAFQDHVPMISLPGESVLADEIEGDYFSVVFPGDTYTPETLGQVAIAIGSGRDAGLVYTDECFMLPGGEHAQPLLKPDWSPDFLLSTPYIARGVFFNRNWVLKAGGIGNPCRYASLYDLALRVSEIGPQPLHLPRVLLNRAAKIEEDCDPGEMAAIIRAAMQRRGLAGEAAPLGNRPGYTIPHILPPETSLTSILIATHDQPELLHKCLESIFALTQHSHFEVVLVDHDSQRSETKEVISSWQAKEPDRFRCLAYSGEFNFSRINNYAASQAKGNLLLLLNNDTEVITPDWLVEMAGYACRPTSGAVGAVLEYPDGTIQHAGILLGVEDRAVHAFKNLPSREAGYMGRLLVPSNYLAVTGACLMVRADVFHSLGGLSEDYAVAGGDIDFCLRAAQKGLYNSILPQVRLIHHESVTRGYEDSYQKFSRLRAELDLLSQRWPEFTSQDPYYHPCLDAKGKFTVVA